jgi:hypothetical protein
MKPTPAVEQVGALIATRYRVEAALGRGGMAVVYRVLDERTGKHVALKRCVARDRSKLARYGALLEREYHTLSQLAHPGIIEVYDYGVDPRGPFYTMELLDGSDLEKTERTPWQTACIALHDVASALAILHSRGLLHRDVSMRNVHVTANGRTKLIDFGAMMTMGVAKDVVGTPPFMAPEVLQLQALDARADLFALGALGYRMLTGRHAFPARRFSELRDVWRSKPVAPHLLVPEIPVELSALILRMLTLDRGGRPQRAAEVIERLRSVANLEREDVSEISRAYLTTPILVGRENALIAVRKQMLALVRGDGGVLLVSGAPGSGRSRVLDACALEGKLLGAAVVRADLRDASSGEWGVASALGNRLLAQFPKQAAEAARLSRNVLGHILEDLRSDDPHTTVTGYAPERSLIIRELRDWVLMLSKAQRLLLVVDDVDRIDDSSLALLSALANKAEQNAILLAVSVADDGKPDEPGLRLLRELGQSIHLAELEDTQTEALIRSVFGDIANLPLCAARIHGLSHGNPRAAMSLAQHLVDTGRARYEAGSWVLPASLDESDLPHTLAESLLSRLSELSENARELVDVLALSDEDSIVMASYAALTSHRDVKRVFQALDELESARILFAGVEHYHFAQRGFLAVLHDAMPEERRRGLHARIARLLGSKGGDVLRRAHHLLESGADGDAIELLGRIDLGTQFPPVSLLMAAIASAERLDVPARTLHRLRMGVLIAAPFSMDYASFRQVAPTVLARLERDSGLANYRELSHLPESERLAAAIAQAQKVFIETPERDRVHPVFEAVRELARLYGALPAMAVPVFDIELLEAMPSLEPMFPLSPTLPIVSQIIEGAKEWIRGRQMASRALYEATLTRIAEPDRGGFDDAQWERVHLALNNALGFLEATHGIEAVEQRAELLEKHRLLRVNAWRIRAMLQLSLGDLAEAGKCSRRAELLNAQEGLKERYVNSTTGIELILRSRLGDLLGVKAQLPLLSMLAQQYEGWRPVEFLGMSRYRELQGDLQAALDLVLAGLEIARPLRSPFFSALAASHISLISDLGRTDEALALARQYAQLCADEQLVSGDVGWRAALVLARAGECDEAVRILTPYIEQSEQLGRSGLAAGTFYETRARIAIAANDVVAFELFAERCAREYEKSNNAALKLQLVRLIDLAKERGLRPTDAITVMRHSLEPPAPESEFQTLHSRIAECVDRDDRGRCVLTLLLQTTASSLGYLYGAHDDRTLTLLGALPYAPLDQGVDRWVESYALKWLTRAEASGVDDEADTATEVEAEDVTQTLSERPSQTGTETETGTGTGTETATGDMSRGQDFSHAYTDPDGRYLEALLLVEGVGRASRLSAVLVVETVSSQPVYLGHALRRRIASELLEHGDVSGWRKP